MLAFLKRLIMRLIRLGSDLSRMCLGGTRDDEVFDDEPPPPPDTFNALVFMPATIPEDEGELPSYFDWFVQPIANNPQANGVVVITILPVEEGPTVDSPSNGSLSGWTMDGVWEAFGAGWQATFIKAAPYGVDTLAFTTGYNGSAGNHLRAYTNTTHGAAPQTDTATGAGNYDEVVMV